MSTDDEKFTVCKARLCKQTSVGIGPASGMQLCKQHLDKDLFKANERKTKLINKLQTLHNIETYRRSLSAEQNSLEAEMQQINVMFDALQVKVQQLRDKTVSRVQAALDLVSRKLKDAAEAEEFANEVTNACDAGDMGKVMELTVSIEPWVKEANERSNNFDEVRSKIRDRQSSKSDFQQCRAYSQSLNRMFSQSFASMERLESYLSGPISDVDLRSVGDVSSGVQQLQFVLDRHMVDVMQKCWLDDAENDSAGAESRVCHFLTSIKDFSGCPEGLAFCTNTAGFVADTSGRVIRADSASKDCMQLPQPCIIMETSPFEMFLLVTSLDGNIRMRIRVETQPAIGLHCDSSLQLLYLATSDKVTVTDLSGQVSRVINASNMNQTVCVFRGIDGNADKLFLLDKENLKILVIKKCTGELHNVIDVSYLASDQVYYRDLCLFGGKILLSNYVTGQVYSVCGSSGCLITTYPTGGSLMPYFYNPWQIATENRGLMFVSEHTGHTVRILASDGSILQTLGTPHRSGNTEATFNKPTSVIVVESDRRILVVSDSLNKRLLLFDIV